MSVFSMGGIGMDLGSDTTLVALQEEGVVLEEATCVLASSENETDVIAIGKEAKKMEGRTDRETSIYEPVYYGAVANTDLAALLILGFAEKALEKRRPFEKNRLCITCPNDATRVEKTALSTSVMLAGAKKAIVVPTVVAAAIGMNVHIERPMGTLVISIGAYLTEITVLSLNGIVASRTLKFGAHAFDDAIIRYIRREKGLVIGKTTAESLKHQLGSAIAPDDSAPTMILRGRNVITGKPSTESITAGDIHNALDEPVNMLLGSIMDALFNIPPQLEGDLLTTGINLTGGGALLTGLAQRLEKETQLKVHISEAPQKDAALGACRIASDDRLARTLLNAGSAIEV